MSQSPLWPNQLQDSDVQIQVTQQALQRLQQGQNQLSGQPAVLLHLPSSTLTSILAITSAGFVNIPGFSWTINSQGGLVCIDAIINGAQNSLADAAVFQLVIDNKNVLNGTWTNVASGSGASSGHIAFSWKNILGVGKHTITFQAASVSGLTVNSSSRGPTSSAVSIIEFPSNISNINVQAN